MARKSQRLRIDMPFEDAVRKILKAGPMPKEKATTQPPSAGRPSKRKTKPKAMRK